MVAAVVLPYSPMFRTIFAGGDAEALRGGLDDPLVGLVRHEQIEIGPRDAVAVHQAPTHFLVLAHGEDEHALPVLMDVMQALVDRLVRRGQLGTACRHAQGRAATAIDFVCEVDPSRDRRRVTANTTTAPAPSPKSTHVVRSV